MKWYDVYVFDGLTGEQIYSGTLKRESKEQAAKDQLAWERTKNPNNHIIVQAARFKGAVARS